MFNENFKHGDKFKVNTHGFEWFNLSDLIKADGHKTFVVQKVFTVVPKQGRGKGKKKPAMVADNKLIWLPEHCLGDVEKILANDEFINAINEGKCGFETSEYEDTQYGNGTCYSGTFIDI